jgi:hypothetical protein
MGTTSTEEKKQQFTKNRCKETSEIYSPVKSWQSYAPNGMAKGTPLTIPSGPDAARPYPLRLIK